ncbi:MAG TPA: protein kinase [Deinococcales bacterium]|nr:protein kinase [Deinococcales bacterium]
MPDLVPCPFCGTPISPSATVCPACGGLLAGPGGLAGANGPLPDGTLLDRGRYRIEKLLGQGGFGITYLARDQHLSRPVAVKELFPGGATRYGANVVPPSNWKPSEFAEASDRFMREGRVLAQFNNRSIVHVLEVFSENATSYLVMEALKGETLHERMLKRGPLPPAEVSDIARQVAGALEVVHAANLLHRDIKPENVFLTDDGRTVLIDFGSARQFVPGKTVSQTRILSPQYAPLEQFGAAGKFGPPTDLYALGATLYHALTGNLPTSSADRASGVPLAPLPRTVPAGLRNAIEESLETRIPDRPATARAFLDRLNSRAPAPASSPIRLDRPPPAPQPETYLLQFGGGYVTDRRLNVGGLDYPLSGYTRARMQPATSSVRSRRRGSLGGAFGSALVTYLVASFFLAGTEAGAMIALALAAMVFFSSISGSRTTTVRRRTQRLLLLGMRGWEPVYETADEVEAENLIRAVRFGLARAGRD